LEVDNFSSPPGYGQRSTDPKGESLNTSRLPSRKSVPVASASITRSLMMFAALICLSGCDWQSKPLPATPGNPSLPRVTLQANRLLDRPESLSNEAVTLTRERLEGDWTFQNESAVVLIQWLPHGYVEAPFSNSPDGMLRINFEVTGLASGSDTFEVVFDSEKNCIEIYEFGTVTLDGSHPAKRLGTATLVGDNLIKVEATLLTLSCEWDIDSTFVRQQSSNKAVNPSGRSGEL
jgi:hypothetical protein